MFRLTVRARKHLNWRLSVRYLCDGRVPWDKMTIREGRSWVTMVPRIVSQLPRARAQALRWSGDSRSAHKVLLAAGADRSRDEKDLVEFLLVLLSTDEFKGPRDRLRAMLNCFSNAPVEKPKVAYNILLAACAREAVRVSDNSSVKKDVILHTAQRVWQELSRKPGAVDPRAVALMYKICGDCKDMDMARKIRYQVNDPPIPGSRGQNDVYSKSHSNEDVTASYILCLGKCGRAREAEQLYFSHENHVHRSSDKILAALFRAHVASNKISKAESLIAMFGSGFLNVQSCNAFVKQCAQLRMHETAVDFVHRMSKESVGFPVPTAHTYNLLLRGLSAGSGAEDRDVAADRALLIVDEMKDQGIEPTAVTYNTLIRSFVFREQMDEALELFKAMEFPNQITFSHLMLGASATGNLDLASKILSWLIEAGERPNYGFCKSYLEVFAQVKGVTAVFEEAKWITERFGDILVFGDVGSREVVRMALINACGAIGDLQAAFDAVNVKLGDDDEEPGNLAPLYVGTVLMQACLKCKAHGRALEVFESLKQAGLHPNFEVYESLIYGLSSYVRKHCTEYDDSKNTMGAKHVADLDDDRLSSEQWHLEDPHSSRQNMSEWASTDRTQASMEEFKKAEKHTRDAGEEGSANGPSPRESLSLAVSLLREMHEKGIARAYRQATYVYNTLIAASAAVGDFELAVQIFNKMSRRNDSGVLYLSDEPENWQHAGSRRTQRVLNSLISTGMFESGFEFPAASVGTYNSMIYAAWMCDESWFCFEVFDMMQMDRTTEPNTATLSLLADIALVEDSLPSECQSGLLRALDKVAILSEDVCRKRVRLRQKLLALQWTQ